MDYQIELDNFGKSYIELKITRDDLHHLMSKIDDKDLYFYFLNIDSQAFELENEEE